jgi:hypothetical protein
MTTALRIAHIRAHNAISSRKIGAAIDARSTIFDRLSKESANKFAIVASAGEVNPNVSLRDDAMA